MKPIYYKILGIISLLIFIFFFVQFTREVIGAVNLKLNSDPYGAFDYRPWGAVLSEIFFKLSFIYTISSLVIAIIYITLKKENINKLTKKSAMSYLAAFIVLIVGFILLFTLGRYMGESGLGIYWLGTRIHMILVIISALLMIINISKNK